MSTYKVIQDIESEDKLLGPFTLRQFVYAGIVCSMGFIAFKLAAVSAFFVIPFILPMGFFALLAAPFGHDQSSEVWLLAKISFFLKPRRRIWNQDGMQELVTITVPKQMEKHLTDGLTQMEVKSRLSALANTIDSRGWAVKNVNVNLYNHPSYLSDSQNTSDRLVEGSSLPQDVPSTEVLAEDDILDAINNPTAQHLDAMISQAELAHHKTLVASVQNGQQPANPPADYWFMSQPSSSNPIIQNPQQPAVGTPAPIQTNISLDDEQHLLEKIHKDKSKPNPAYGHMHTLNPKGSSKSRAKTQGSSRPNNSKLDTQNSQLDANKATIARLAGNDDLNVSTIAREADKANKKSNDDEEVVISLR